MQAREATERDRRWAARTAFADDMSPLAEAVARARADGGLLLDLTVSNPTRCGFAYPVDAILQGLASPDGLVYRADPLGAFEARRNIADLYYGARALAAAPDRMLLTSSTSEAYGYLLRLLCDAGDEILVPEPSYPLFDLLARLHDVHLKPYPLRRHDGWRIDWRALRESVSSRTRAIVVVHPNNPTGHAIDVAERALLEEFALAFGLALIVDEVFLDFGVESAAPRSFVDGAAPVLTFVLSGLSKVLALPQMKLAWTVVRGPEATCAEAMRRLEFIADTFLSPNTPVQQAVGGWLRFAPEMQAQITGRVRQNLAALDRALGDQQLCSRDPVHAGWCVLLRIPATLPDDEVALWLTKHRRIAVHPGSFYGLPASGWLVLSLLPEPDVFTRGVQLLVDGVAELVHSEPGLA